MDVPPGPAPCRVHPARAQSGAGQWTPGVVGSFSSVLSTGPRHSAPHGTSPHCRLGGGHGHRHRLLPALTASWPRPHRFLKPLHRQRWQRAPNGGRGVGSPACLPAPRRPPPRAQITRALPSLHPRSSLCTLPCSHRPPLSEPASLSSSPCSSYLDSCSEIHINHFYLSFENDTPGGYIQIFLYIFLLFTYLETEIAWSGDLSEVKLYYQPQI